jgi:hypothetical protein
MSSYRRAAVVAWALIGLLLGHTLAYAATFRDPQVLLHVLEDTGHNWLSLTPVFVALLIALLVVTSARGATGATSLRRRYVTIATLQLGAYIAVEVIERLAHGSSLSDVAAGLTSGYGPTLLAFGVAAQLLVAAGTALLSRAVERVVARLRAVSLRQVASAPNANRITAQQVLLRTLFGGLSQGVRAPPLS